ncbi:MAG: hypothetical protein ACRDLO_04585 [Solirubrobacterales bacterium]
MSEIPRNDEATLLKRLLGPAGPEISCEECFEQLDRYVELELSGADADAAIPGMGAHLEGCPACGEDHRSLRALVEAESASPPPPPGD